MEKISDCGCALSPHVAMQRERWFAFRQVGECYGTASPIAFATRLNTSFKGAKCPVEEVF
ncbi:MAG: hypothetical protein V7K42_27385 [Nostoc sp.]